MGSIAALVITRNEAVNITGCLQCLSWVDELIVIDSYSEDDTIQLSEKFTKHIYQRKFDNFANQRNFGLEKVQSEWVLVVDADERITEALKQEIFEKIQHTEIMGYFIPRKNYFLGKWIKYCGWYPNYTLRLFRSTFRYYGLVHEKIEITGKTEYLKKDMIHFTYSDLRSYLDKMNHYTSLDAQAKHRAGVKVGITYILFRPALEFIKKYFIKRGFLLGKEGLFLSILSAYYQFLKYIKLWEIYNAKSDK